MIRVTVEILQYGEDKGDENEIRGVMYLHNDLEQTLATAGRRGTYIARLFKKRNAKHAIVCPELVDVMFDPWAIETITNYPRNSYHVWNLVRLALNQIADKNGGRI